MSDLEAPPIPYLSETRLRTRERHLVSEITMFRRRRQRRRVAVGGAGLVASGLTAALAVMLIGAGTPSAYAAWTPAPTTPAPGEIRAAEATCEAGAVTPPVGAPAVPANVSLTDTRGPFTLVLFGAGTSTQGVLMCLSGPDGTHFSISTTSGSQPAPPGTDHISLDRLQGGSANGRPYIIAEGSAGAGVSATTLALSDGSQVTASVGNGLFLAWWPGSATVTSATVTTASGTTAQSIIPPAIDTNDSGTIASGGTYSGNGNRPHTSAQWAELRHYCERLKAQHPDLSTTGPCALLKP